MKENLTTVRKSFDMTLNDLGRKMGISKQFLCDIEKGRRKPSVKLKVQLAKYFKVPVNKLFVDDKEENNMLPVPKKLYDVDEFRSEVLNNKVSKSTIYAKIKSGEIKAVKIGRKPFIPAWFVDELLTSRNI